MKNFPALIFPILLLSCFLHAQSAADSLRFQPNVKQFHKIAGLNMSPLVTQLIPFNRASPKEAGPFLLRFKSYGKKGKTAFRFSLGVHLVADSNGDLDDPQVNLAMGWEKRKSISRRWSYTKGFDFMLLAGDLNIPGTAKDENFAAFGLGPLWGIEYMIDRRISIGTEAVLLLGVTLEDGIGVFDILPPVGLFLNHYF